MSWAAPGYDSITRGGRGNCSIARRRRMPRNVKFFIESIRRRVRRNSHACEVVFLPVSIIPAFGSIDLPPPGRPSGESMLTIFGLCFLTYARISSSENAEQVSTEKSSSHREPRRLVTSGAGRFRLSCVFRLECSEAIEYEPEAMARAKERRLQIENQSAHVGPCS